MRSVLWAVCVLGAFSLASCAKGSGNTNGNASDAGLDASAVDASLDAGFDAGVDATVKPSGPTRIYGTGGGGTTQSAGYRARISIGAPQPSGRSGSDGHQVQVGPKLNP